MGSGALLPLSLALSACRRGSDPFSLGLSACLVWTTLHCLLSKAVDSKLPIVKFLFSLSSHPLPYTEGDSRVTESRRA